MSTDILEKLCRTVDARGPALWRAESYYAGTQPLAFLSPEARRHLGDRLTQLNANYPRLATDSVAERLNVQGFTRDGESLGSVWEAWKRSGMLRKSHDAILEALTTGQSFLVVWADANGAPVVSVESPREMAVSRDPLSGEILWAAKRWRGIDGKAHAVLYGQDRVNLYTGPDVPEGGVLPNVGWTMTGSLNNPMGVCPVAELTNSTGMWDFEGSPESQTIWSLCDALNKTIQDSLTASESTAYPRRYATGLAIAEDDDGTLRPPVSDMPGHLWTAENPDVRFGQFPEVRLESYTAHVEMLIRQIGAIAGLPDHLVGISGVDPSSAEQIRAADSSLVSRAYARQPRLGTGIAKAAALIEAILTGGRVATDVEVTWKSPESRTRAAQADATAKLVQSGILPLEVAWAELGYSPTEIVRMRQARMRQSVDTSTINLQAVDQ